MALHAIDRSHGIVKIQSIGTSYHAGARHAGRSRTQQYRNFDREPARLDVHMYVNHTRPGSDRVECVSGTPDGEKLIDLAFGKTTYALKIRPAWLQQILAGPES